MVTFLSFEKIATKDTIIFLKNSCKVETKNKRRENALGGIKKTGKMLKD